MMSNDIPEAGIKWCICDEGHVHLIFHDAEGKDITSVAVDLMTWFDLADAIDEEIERTIATEESAGAIKH